MSLTINIGYYRRIFSAYIFNRRSSNLSFWHTKLKANAMTGQDRGEVRRYPMSFEEKTKFNSYTDPSGVIMLNYGGDLGIQYNPNAIAQVALGFYELYLDALEADDKNAKERYMKSFLTQAQWFISHGTKVKDDILLWEYDFSFENREYMEKPWRTALAQGQALSVLIRAHMLTNDELYLEKAKKGFNSFRYVYLEHEGGVIYREGNNVWLEEALFKIPNHILNGFIWALWGVRDYAVYFNDEYARQLYEDSEKTLLLTLNRYDLGFWTCYDDKTCIKGPIMPVSSYYQRLHITQLKSMYELTENKIYLDMHKKWLAYYENTLYRTLAFIWKCYFKLRYW